jgi:MvdD-like protein with pre-ATP grasp domain/ribosomal protein S6-L-glutamate ligase RimK-like protein
MILIVSNTQDLTCDFVVRELQRRRSAFSRLNFDEFPRFALGVATAGTDYSERAEITWTNRKKVLYFNEVSSVLYRRPVSPVPDCAEDEAIKRFCVDECYDFLRGLLLSLDCHWISHPDAIRKAEHKLYQMRVATRVGLRLPKTLVSNSPDEVLNFFETCSGRMVVKCLYMGFIDNQQAPELILTSLVSREDLNDAQSIRLSPSIFQEYVDKNFDLRVTVVGERVFAAKIETTLPPDTPDWRACSPEELRHSLYHLPVSVERACIDLVRLLNLDFGAIDFAVDKRGEIYFLEINPNGQWAWLETILALPISAALVDRLEEMGR